MKRFRILVVDDEERIINFLRSKLKASGYEVLTARNGVEGLDQVQAQEPDLIVLDLLMPKMNGLQALKKMRGIRPDLKVILTSGYEESFHLRKEAEMVADSFLQKPYREELLRSKLRDLLDSNGDGA